MVADVWSVTSFTQLRRDGLEVERWNMLHPTAKARQAYCRSAWTSRRGPVVASTDYIRGFADQIRQWVPGSYRVLGTDGYGRSDSRRALRRFFEVDRHYVAVAALKELADVGEIDPGAVQEAIERYESIPRPNAHGRMSATSSTVEVPDIGDFDDVPVIEILVAVGDTCRRGPAGHARVRQGDDGRARAVRRRGQGAQRQVGDASPRERC